MWPTSPPENAISGRRRDSSTLIWIIFFAAPRNRAFPGLSRLVGNRFFTELRYPAR
jgi:hypothetical protein